MDSLGCTFDYSVHIAELHQLAAVARIELEVGLLAGIRSAAAVDRPSGATSWADNAQVELVVAMDHGRFEQHLGELVLRLACVDFLLPSFALSTPFESLFIS